MTSTNTLPTHPRTGLRALGMTRRGPIWPQLGGDGQGDGGDGQGGTAGAGQQGTGTGTGAGGGGGGGTGQAQQGQGQQTPGGQQAGQQQGGQAPPLGPDGQPWDPARANTLIANLRAELATLKGKQGGAGGQQGAGQQDGQGQAPGQQQTPAGQAPATDEATAAKLHAANTKIAVLEQSAAHGANPAALADSMSFMAQVAELDPAADDYTKKFGDAVKKHLETNPHHRAGQALRGGSDGSGRPGATGRKRGLNNSIAAYYADKK